MNTQEDAMLDTDIPARKDPEAPSDRFSPSWTRSLKFYTAGWLLYLIVRALALTYRVKIFHVDGTTQAKALHKSGSYCLAIWHEYLFASIVIHRGQPFAPLASLSKDGDVATFILKRLGYRTIRGSSSRGGKEARSELIDVTSQGWFTAITIDGPRGPRRVVKSGVIDIARRSGVAIVPLVAAADREWVFRRSWDQFKLPKPFARIAVQYGDPIVVPQGTEGAAFDACKDVLHEKLLQVEQDARVHLKTWSKR